MKTRSSFVANSSSSSFIISLDNLSKKQIEQIENHIETANSIDMKGFFDYTYDEGDSWDSVYVDTEQNILKGWTIMDNFPMSELLEKIGVDPKDVKWEDY